MDVNIRAEVSSIIPSLDTLPLPLCTLAITYLQEHNLQLINNNNQTFTMKYIEHSLRH